MEDVPETVHRTHADHDRVCCVVPWLPLALVESTDIALGDVTAPLRLCFLIHNWPDFTIIMVPWLELHTTSRSGSDGLRSVSRKTLPSIFRFSEKPYHLGHLEFWSRPVAEADHHFSL